MALNDRQKRFCEEYLIDRNATQAAIRAGYSEKTAHSIGNENLKKPEIEKYITELKEKQSKRTEITADKVLRELGMMAFSEVETITSKDKIKALELIGKHLGMFESKIDEAECGSELPMLMEALKDDIS